MARFVYSLLFYLLIPFICLRLWWRGRRLPGYRRRWRERFGFMVTPCDERPLIWVHAVSVGETIAAIPLVKKLQATYPDHLLAVTTTTPTGSERVKAMLGDSVYHCYAPYDFPGAVKRALIRLRPRCLVIMETELWPNLIHHCHRRGVPVVVANARLSARSAAGYGRFGPLSRPMLEKVTTVGAQYREDGERFLRLGLPANRLAVTGSIKFDIAFTEGQRLQAAALGRQWRGGEGRPVWLAASTHPGEEALVLDAFDQVCRTFPSLLLVLVPRHPDRFDAVAALCAERGYQTERRSSGQPPSSHTAVLLGDTMGELPVFYGACDLAFVGGSLVPVGGHNLLEPAAWNKPVLSGPVLFNFAEISNRLLTAQALAICDSPAALGRELETLLKDERLREARGRAAGEVVAANRGALDALMGVIERAIG